MFCFSGCYVIYRSLMKSNTVFFFPSHISSFVTWLHFNLALNLLHIKHRKNKVTIKDMGIIYCSYHLYIQFELQNKVDNFFFPCHVFWSSFYFGLLYIFDELSAGAPHSGNTWCFFFFLCNLWGTWMSVNLSAMSTWGFVRAQNMTCSSTLQQAKTVTAFPSFLLNHAVTE